MCVASGTVQLASMLPREDLTAAESQRGCTTLEKECNWSVFRSMVDLRSSEESQASDEGCG